MEEETLVVDGDLYDVEISELKAHSELCPVQTFCMNGGTCFRMPSLGRQYCQCPENFEGERCHMKTVVIPDYDQSKYDTLSLSWNNIQPIAIVVGCALIVMVVLFFVFLVSRKCYNHFCQRRKLHINIPRRTLYKNASAQTSSSQLLLLGDAPCNGHVTGETDSMSRNRLKACSTTPEAEQPYRQINRTAHLSVDLEAGPRCAHSVDSSYVAPKSATPTSVSLENDTTESRRILSESAKLKSRKDSASHLASRNDSFSKHRSPNDSNNNMDAQTVMASRPAKDSKSVPRSVQSGHVTDQSRPTTANGRETQGLLRSQQYDSDPDATAV